MGKGRWYLAQRLHLLRASALRHTQHRAAADLEPGCEHTYGSHTHSYLTCTHIPLIHLPVMCSRASAQWILHKLLKLLYTFPFNWLYVISCAIPLLCNTGFNQTIWSMIIDQIKRFADAATIKTPPPPPLLNVSAQRIPELECSLM